MAEKVPGLEGDVEKYKAAPVFAFAHLYQVNKLEDRLKNDYMAAFFPKVQDTLEAFDLFPSDESISSILTELPEYSKLPRAVANAIVTLYNDENDDRRLRPLMDASVAPGVADTDNLYIVGLRRGSPHRALDLIHERKRGNFFLFWFVKEVGFYVEGQAQFNPPQWGSLVLISENRSLHGTLLFTSLLYTCVLSNHVSQTSMPVTCADPHFPTSACSDIAAACAKVVPPARTYFSTSACVHVSPLLPLHKNNKINSRSSTTMAAKSDRFSDWMWRDNPVNVEVTIGRTIFVLKKKALTTHSQFFRNAFGEH
ncbi:hypothetical protein IWX90DRAFT_491491 [Phyllosticta citrichinensis]|uniref:BTB domain-containing protein n=1 Tax=Phyllosticta citrichinensis TaxID=1130410 RepID=A0ABR1Y5F1_9PEZI